MSYEATATRGTNANAPKWEFRGPAEVKSGPRYAYRVYGGESKAEGRFLTPGKPTTNARKELALPAANNARYHVKAKISENATYLEGKVAPGFGQPGGGRQIKVLGERKVSATQLFGRQMPGTTPRGALVVSPNIIHSTRRKISVEERP